MYENVQAGWEIDASVLVFRGGLCAWLRVAVSLVTLCSDRLPFQLFSALIPFSLPKSLSGCQASRGKARRHRSL